MLDSNIIYSQKLASSKRELRIMKGIITALITPFNKEGEVIENSMEDLIDFQVEAGINGLFLCGTAGLGAVMRTGQRKRVFEIAVEHASGRIPIIAHVGTPSTEESLQLAMYAKDAGVDAIGCVAPYYFRPDESSIIHHFSRISDVVDIPIYVYNIPRSANINIRPDLMLRLCKIDKIVGVKDGSSDFTQVLEYLQILPPEISVICGNDSYILPALIMGARGAITGYANAFPEVYVDFYKQYLKGDIEAARKQQFRINALRNALQRPPIAPHYEVIKLRGIEVGYPRALLRAMTKRETDLLKTKLGELDLLFK